MLRTRAVRAARAAVLLAVIVAAGSGSARATPYDFISVGDPLEAELRVLDVLGPTGYGALRLPHLGLRPLQVLELGPDSLAADGDASRSIARARIDRALARDRAAAGPLPPGATPRLVQWRGEDPGGGEPQRLELSVGVEGRGDVDLSLDITTRNRNDSRIVSGSGVHERLGIQFERWLLYSHLFAGRVDSARTFADPIVAGNDLIVHTEESYVAYTGARALWGVQFGRSRWHWGPGDEAGLVLSRTSAPLTGLAARARIDRLGLDAMTLSATLDAAAGEQLAAHRIEWQPWEPVRLGVSEAARYRSDAWQPLYLVGVLPYVLVQRLQAQDEPDSASALRNNVFFGIDAAWRIAPGTRVYAELAIDDLHARTRANPDKYGVLLGWEGAGTIMGSRVTWGTEFARITRFMYTSAYGRDFTAQRRPLGYPTGPDARRLRVRGAWDPTPAWQLAVQVARTDKGENDVGEPFVPGSPSVSTGTFEGVVERTRDAELTLRWWPASGVDVAVSGGYRWVENVGHVASVDRDGARGGLAVRLVR